jgi:redox-regulated HSP33 family molecular chaperone
MAPATAAETVEVGNTTLSIVGVLHMVIEILPKNSAAHRVAIQWEIVKQALATISRSEETGVSLEHVLARDN